MYPHPWYNVYKQNKFYYEKNQNCMQYCIFGITDGQLLSFLDYYNSETLINITFIFIKNHTTSIYYSLLTSRIFSPLDKTALDAIEI